MKPTTFLEQVLFSILRIELFSESGANRGMGTGFLLQVDVEDGSGKVVILLISNKHVFEGGKQFVVNFHLRSLDGEGPDIGKVHRLHARDFSQAYFFHPDPNIDLACVNISSVVENLQATLFYRVLTTNLLSDFSEPELDVGQKIVFVGYPDDRYDRKNNLPIVRDGIIASHPKIDFNGNKQFLIDAQVFPGSSGSPVFLNVKEAQFNQGRILVGGGGLKYKFLGVVAATMIRNNKINFAPVNYEPSAQEVIGLGIVFKATALRELINKVLSAQS